MIDTTFKLEINGKIKVYERAGEMGGYSITPLIEREYDVTLSVDAGDEFEAEELFRKHMIGISLRAYHVTNEANGKTFHTGIEAVLSREDAMELRAYLDFLLAATRCR